MNAYAIIVEDPDPMGALVALGDEPLGYLIEDLQRLEEPNEFQAKVFCWAVTEAVKRWKEKLVAGSQELES